MSSGVVFNVLATSSRSTPCSPPYATGMRQRRGCRRNGQPCQRGEFLAEGVEADLKRIVMHQQRSIGWHGLGDAGDRITRQGAIERQHSLVGRVVDVAAEFHR